MARRISCWPVVACALFGQGCSAGGGNQAPASEQLPPGDAAAPTRQAPTELASLPVGVVRGERQCSADGPSRLTIELFAEPLECGSIDLPEEFLWIELPFAPGDDLPRSFRVGAAAPEGAHACHTRPATGSRCVPVTGQVSLHALVPGSSAAGTIELELGDGNIAAGHFEVRWCGEVFGVKECPHSTTSTPSPQPGTCSAPAPQCCLEDGTVVTPGGCQPSYPKGVRPGTERGPDGFCRSIACYLKCLPATAVIETPGGGRLISQLEIGDPVWTVDEHGQPVVEPIEAISRVPIPGEHELVELALDDGRLVRASAGHPTAADTRFGDLRPGERLDGATVVGVRRLPYAGRHTHDILPGGATGLYWADGVLLGSTLSEPLR